MVEYSKFFETIFDGYVLLDTGIEALKAYLSSLKGNENQKFKYLYLLKEIADEIGIVKVLDKSQIDKLIQEVINRQKNIKLEKDKKNNKKGAKIRSFDEVVAEPVNTFDDELLKYQYLYNSSIIYVDSVNYSSKENQRKNLFSEADEKAFMFQEHFNLIKYLLSKREFNHEQFLASKKRNNKELIITELGSLQGTEENVVVFGMLLKTESRNYQLQDLTTRINIDLSNVKRWGKGYFTPGCCVICWGFFKNNKLFVDEISHPDFIWNTLAFEEKYEKDYFGAITKAFKNNKNKGQNSSNPNSKKKGETYTIYNNPGIHFTIRNLLQHDIGDNKILYPKTVNIKSKINKGVQVIKDSFFEKNKISNLFMETKQILTNQFFLILSNVNLADNEVLKSIKLLITSYSKPDITLPFMIIFMGNFFKEQSFSNFKLFSSSFEQLEKILLENKKLVDNCYFVFIPGPEDLSLFNGFPKYPFIPSIIEKMKEKIPNVINATNPCRFSIFGKEVVFFRDDLHKKLSRNSINDIENNAANNNEENNQSDLFVETVLRQGNLAPLTLNLSPRIWHLAHKMMILPLPDILILGDITEKFKKYYNFNNLNQNNNINSQNMNELQNQNEGKILVINPGDFSKDTLFASVNPSTLESNIYNLK
jgi:hypothetical protein